MEVLVILLFIVLIFLIVSFRSRALQRIDQLEGEIRRMRQEFSHTGGPAAPSTPTLPIPTETEPFIPPSRKEPAPVQREFQPPPAVTQPHSFQQVSSRSQADPVTVGTGRGPGMEQQAAEPPAPGFFEKHPDLEKFIGENLVSKIGIAILVLAIGFFVKYAIDNEWIGPIGRVGVGLLCGGILIGIAHVMRNSYKAFSSVLVGGGLAVFYFTIALAYHQYHLFSQSMAFIIMLVITAFSVILSILYDRQELAIIALVGGFVTPFLVSNGSGNYRVLFSYLLILNGGLLVIAYRKAWRLLNLLAFGFTAILFTSWLITLPYDATASTFRGGFLFATTFYILFFIINIAHNIRENKKFIASDFGILLANTCLYFAAGLYMIAAMGMVKYQGLFSACMGVFNLCGSYFLFRTKKVDSNILYLLIGITLTFISLTAPIQLHGHYITLFWATESVLLYWLSRKSGIRVIGVASLVVWIAMLVSLVMDWAAVYGNVTAPLPIIFNKGLMTSFYSALCCIGLFLLRKRRGEGAVEAGERGLIDKIADNSVIIVGCLLFFSGGGLELYHQFNFYYPDSPLFTLYFVLYGFLWSSFISYAGSRWKWFGHYTYATTLLAVSIAIYLVLTPATYDIQVDLLGSGRYVAHFAAHWVSAMLVALMIIRLTIWWRQGKIEPVIPPEAFTWIICTVIVIFLSAEIELLANHLFYSKANPFPVIARVYHKAGLAILWGLCSFIFMWLGMRNKFKTLRIVSLFLFSLTLLKLFLYDIRNIPIAGKIAAFFCLGVLLLVVSFMYQRLKKIIIEDEEKKTA